MLGLAFITPLAVLFLAAVVVNLAIQHRLGWLEKLLYWAFYSWRPSNKNILAILLVVSSSSYGAATYSSLQTKAVTVYEAWSAAKDKTKFLPAYDTYRGCISLAPTMYEKAMWAFKLGALCEELGDIKEALSLYRVSVALANRAILTSGISRTEGQKYKTLSEDRIAVIQ